MVTKSVLQIDVKDNVMVALQNLKKGDLINKYNKEVILQNDITAKHKSFIRDMQPGDDVIMYGVLVGKAHEFIPVGGLMTKENITHAAGVFAYRSSQYVWVRPNISRFADKTFNGYKRADGRVGTANYWLFIPAVFCENRNLDVIREALYNELGYVVTHKYKQYTRHLVEALKKAKTK